MNAIRRSPRWFAMRRWWHGLDVATGADIIFGSALLLTWLAFSLVIPWVFA